MCHQTVQPFQAGQNQASGDAPAPPPPPQRYMRPEPAAREGDLNLDTGTSIDMHSNDVTPGPTEQQLGERESFGDGDCGTEDKDQSAQGLCFSSSGDFVGFVSPVTSCSSCGLSSLVNDLPGITISNMQHQDEENGNDLLPPPSTGFTRTEDESVVAGHGAELKDSFTSCPGLPQHGYGKPNGISKSWNSLNSKESSNADKNQESVSHPVNSDMSHYENSELLDFTDDSQSRKGNGTHLNLDLDGLGEAELVPPSLAQAQTTDCPASVP